MYLEDLKKDFYEFIKGKRICIITNYDIDSICTTKILQALLKHNHVMYSLAVVQEISDLKTLYEENSSDVKYFVLVNCGGTIDLVDLLEPEDDVIFFIIDSHRPTDLCNIYSNGQIRLMWQLEDDCDVPQFQDIFQEDESDDELEDEGEGSENEEENRAAKRRRLDEEEILKRRQKRLWEANRDKLVFDYSQFTYHSKASALSMFDLAWKLNKDDKDLLWYTIVAITEQMIFFKIENTQYIMETSNLQAHVTRHHHKSIDTDNATSLKITFEQDLKLMLYRHWSVKDSLKYSMFTACKLKLWSYKGDKKLNELLADMGLPLVQSKQKFISMDLQLRQEFHGALQRLAEKYGLTDLAYATFILTYGYRNKYCASDVVYGMLAILETPSRVKEPDECFQTALDCLSRSNNDILTTAIEKSKNIAMTLFKTVQYALEMKKIISAGPFIYFIIQESCLDWCMFSHQHILSLLAQFIIRAYVAMSRNRKATSIPLIVSAPKNIENGTCVVLGIPPVCENSPKNFFGKAFEQAAERISCDTVSNYFNTAYFDIPVKDRTRFLDALTALLTL